MAVTMKNRPFKIPGLWLLDRSGAVKIDPGRITYCYHNKDVTRIVYSGGYHTSVHVPLKKLEEKLPGKIFFRCHRNYLINLNQAFEGTFENNVLKLPGRRTVPVARRKKARLLLMLGQIARERGVN
jgi:DNA-binding LytR/AlgR family response regulator